MTLDAVRIYCLAKPGTSEDCPFGPDPLVFRVMGKMFALLSLDAFPSRINLKCDPEKAIELRERYAAVLPGYHMNKQHWNTVLLDGSLPSDQVRRQIDASYRLVVSRLTKRQQTALAALD